MKIFSVISLVWLGLNVGCLPIHAASRPVVVDAIAAVVQDSIITSQEVLDPVTVANLQQQYGSDPAALNKKLEQYEHDNLEMLIRRQLILHEFKTAGYSLTESAIEDWIQQQIKDNYGTRRAWINTLREKGMTQEQFRRQMREKIIVDAMTQKHLSSDQIIVSPHKVEAYYAAHKADFKVDDQVKLRMIVLNKAADPPAPPTKEMAQEIVDQLDHGASFGQMQAVYSQTSGGDSDGEWYSVTGLRKELSVAAAKLKPGQHSGVIDTPDKYYIMLVQDVKPAHFQPISEVRDSIERNLSLEEKQRLDKQWVDQLRKKTFVQLY
jgi:peptidyl-prolyl cis-trans isomerase SurA